MIWRVYRLDLIQPYHEPDQPLHYLPLMAKGNGTGSLCAGRRSSGTYPRSRISTSKFPRQARVGERGGGYLLKIEGATE